MTIPNLFGLLDGITAGIIVITGALFGALSFYHAKKLGAKLLYYAGILVIVVGFLWLGPFTEFLSVLFFSTNIPGEVYGWLSYFWVAPGITLAMYIGGELLAPDKKKLILAIFIILGIIFELWIFLFPNGNTEYGLGIFPILDWGTFEWEAPAADGLINTGFNMSLAYILVFIFLISVLIFDAIGFGLKAKQSTGELRRKFTYLSIAFTIFFVCGLLDSVIPVGLLTGIVRGVMATFAIWTYLGLKV
ncbi:MAG: hypothetical protein EU547_06595 [Promethearchaeota archaeon]|nr:MAG: hypothetical protein EU547_06595 [Candidatus Lokiarchaeota archaeon]